MARKRADDPQPTGPPMSEQERKELDDRLAKLVTKPTRTELFAGRFFLLWSARDESGGAQVMVWNVETPDEVRAANFFYDAAHGLGAFAKPVQKGKPVPRSAEHKAFIVGILAARDDDTGYLAYADYLTEHGNTQGDYIRLCVELAKHPDDSPEAEEINRRMNELSEAHLEEWFAPLGELGLRPEFYGHFTPWAWMSYERGVIEEVSIDRPGVLPENADRLFAAAPFLRKLQFERGHLDPAKLAKVKQLSQIEELDLYRTDLTADGLRALLASKYLSGLKRLNLSGNQIGHAGIHELVTWPGLARLESLELTACNVGPEAIVELRNSPNLANLKRLRVGTNGIDPDAARSLLGTPFLKSVTELELGSTEFDVMAAHQFRLSPLTSRLQHLDLDYARFQPGAFEEFTKCRFPALRVLKLNNVNLQLPAASHLANAKFRDTLEELYIDNCRLGMASGNFFYQAKFPKLRVLDISRNRIERYGLEMLASRPARFPSLTNLRLWDNRLTPPAIATLTTRKVLANLTHLDLNGNKIGPAGAVALAKSKYLTKLAMLVVDEKPIGKKGKQALLERFGESVVSFR